jgi:hypothetical protein
MTHDTSLEKEKQMDTLFGPSPPELSRGAHLSPGDGTCLMEAVSIAAQLPFTDAPACTPPLLAYLARLANDSCSDVGRQQLSALVPDLIATRSGNAAQTALAAAQVALASTNFALARQPTLLLSYLQRRATREVELDQRPAGDTGAKDWNAARYLRTRVRRHLFLRGPGSRAVEAAVSGCMQLPVVERDEALVALLSAAVASAHPRPIPLPTARDAVHR